VHARLLLLSGVVLLFLAVAFGAYAMALSMAHHWMQLHLNTLIWIFSFTIYSVAIGGGAIVLMGAAGDYNVAKALKRRLDTLKK